MKKPKILIVEDEIIIAHDLKMRLEQHGYDVLPIASTANEAVSLAHQYRPDIILMDVILKGHQTGIDVALQIHKSKNTPIIFLTGNQHLIDKNRIKEIKNYRILSKPPSDFELSGEINNAIQH